ncbi:MAG: succinate dehydrogenase assembly factor 2 [Candidatus Accumulibacter sp.]|jgi:succinate dehydrogenase flavin-adding protein (antitoxin of CptAB toxin-antitoxin module)|nr:succinate dehydrogenase assembly factor 2 [Accumulibacter sp.]
MLNETEMKRLRWRCAHRARRELDLLLENFLDTRFRELSPEQEAAFVILAEMEDVELWPLVTGRRQCQDIVQTQVLDKLRRFRSEAPIPGSS